MTEYNTKGLSIIQTLLILGVGLAACFLPQVVTAIWGGVFLITVVASISGRQHWVWYGIAASPGLEVWSRMVNPAVMVDEVGKYYLLLAIPAVFLHHTRERSAKPLYRTGLWVILLLIPSLIAALPEFDREQWVFNILGLLELAVLLILTARERWDVERFARTLQFGLMPLLLMVVYLLIKTPEVNNINFSLGASFTAAGGGTNQVSTVLGVGIVFTTLLLLMKRPVFSVKWLSYILLVFLFYRAFLTFSRGGVLAAVMSVCIAFFYAIIAGRRNFIRYSFIVLVFGLVAAIVFVRINDVLDNKLMQRYMGETVATLSGEQEKTLNKMTSGRSALIKGELEMFADNPVFGVGPGGGKKLRTRYGGHSESAAHTEFTRLMAEHGIGGLLAGVVLLVFPFIWMRKQRYKLWKGVCGALFCLAILTTSHSAMRTNTTIVCYALASIPVFARRNNITRT